MHSEKAIGKEKQRVSSLSQKMGITKIKGSFILVFLGIASKSELREVNNLYNQ